MRDAAVLIPTWRDEDDELCVVLVLRSDHGPHGGQLAFPGGKLEAGESARDAAVREAEEEIGLEPSRVRIVATLPVFETMTTGWNVAPFLARIDRPEHWRPDPTEIADVLEPRLRDLADPAARGEAVEDFAPFAASRRTPHLKVEGRHLWGVTYRILEPILPALVRGDWDL